MFVNDLFYGIHRFLNKRKRRIYKSKVHKTSVVCNSARVVNSSVSKYSYISKSLVINCNIGSFCSIADGCIIGGGNHPSSWVSTSPVFYSNNNVLRTKISKLEYTQFENTIIGNDVWIGSNCLIKGGVSIGTGAIIGMGSVVTKNVPPYEIWAGNPAKFIRKRFNEEIIEELLKTQWWDLDIKSLKKYSCYFNNVTLFVEKMKGD